MKKELLFVIGIVFLAIIVKLGSLYADDTGEYDYTASIVVDEVAKTEYKDVRYEVVAVLTLETANFTGLSLDQAKAVALERITYLRAFNFPTKRKGFIKALMKVPGVGRPYATDKEYLKKVRSIARRLRKM